MKIKFLISPICLCAALIVACNPKIVPTKTNPITIVHTKDWSKPDITSSLVELTTTKGIMKIELYKNTPEHRENFIKLIKEGYYEGLLFHRIVQGFMIQGGDPTSRGCTPAARLGSGGPGYTMPNEILDENVHLKGALAAARTSDDVNPRKESSGSQYYIVQGRPISKEQIDDYERQKDIIYTLDQRKYYQTIGGTPQLDKEYTVFGRVYEGLDIIDSIAAMKTRNDSRPKEDVYMNFTIIRE
jgi:cyclophilin family peptidyl-prolyl cis-trans isomerase